MPSTSNIWIIDIGGSYKRICENVDGVYLDFREDSDIVVNPFSDCDNLSEDMDLLKSLISKMAKPTERVTDTETSVIEEAIKNAYLKYERKTNIDRIIEALREMSDGKDPIKGKACDTIATNLFRWGSDGVFGKFFNGQNNVDLDHRFIVLELKNLSRREDLRNVILMVLFYHIQKVVYMDDDRSKRKLLIFDEAWQFFRTKLFLFSSNAHTERSGNTPPHAAQSHRELTTTTQTTTQSRCSFRAPTDFSFPRSRKASTCSRKRRTSYTPTSNTRCLTA